MEEFRDRYRQDIKDIPGWFQTRSGETVTSRLIRPDDTDLLIDFVRRLTPESRRRRFHHNVENISDREIRERARRMSDVDNLTQGGAVLALADDPDGTQHIIGVARFGRLPGKPDDPTADAAIVVRDDYHGQGVGTELLRRLVLLAKQMKVEQMIAVIESDNTSAIRLFRNLGLPTEIEIHQGETTLTIEMPQD